MSRNPALTWCNDTLHSIIGCSDNALAQYLTTEATSASSHHSILNILIDGNVQPVNASGSDGKRVLERFAQDLWNRCHSNSHDRGSNGNVQKARVTKKTNADWVKSAANYDLLDDDDDYNIQPKYTETNAKTKEAKPKSSSTEPPKQISIKKKKDREEDRSRERGKDKESRSRSSKRSRRRRRSRSSSESSGSDDNGDVRQRYEERVEERRQNRDRKRRAGTTRSPSPVDNGGNAHVSDYDSVAQGHDLDEEKYQNLTEAERAELEREKDIRERDEFAKRLLDRDKHKTSKHDELYSDAEHDKKDDDEYQKRIDLESRLARGETVYDQETGKQITLSTLREESRRSYLKKRKERELTLLERELAEEEEMFGSEKLTEGERKRLELRREVLKLAKQGGDAAGKDEKGDFYRLPDEYEEREGRTKAEKDSALLKSRYVEEKYEKTEQQLWEEEQTKKASIVPTKKRGKQNDATEKEYDLVFDDQIDFVMTSKKDGYDNRNKKSRDRRGDDDDESMSSRHSRSSSKSLEKKTSAKPVKALTKHEKILVGRKKLPVFPYREEFLAAVKDHQVLILVGETGSGKT